MEQRKRDVDMKNVFSAIVYKEENLYVAQYPELGTASQGETIEEAVSNLQEATELYLEEFPQTVTHHPFLTTFEVPAYA
jgi:predicted RNase H-like HicB family nuclease